MDKLPPTAGVTRLATTTVPQDYLNVVHGHQNVIGQADDSPERTPAEQSDRCPAHCHKPQTARAILHLAIVTVMAVTVLVVPELYDALFAHRERVDRSGSEAKGFLVQLFVFATVVEVHLVSFNLTLARVRSRVNLITSAGVGVAAVLGVVVWLAFPATGPAPQAPPYGFCTADIQKTPRLCRSIHNGSYFQALPWGPT